MKGAIFRTDDEGATDVDRGWDCEVILERGWCDAQQLGEDLPWRQQATVVSLDRCVYNLLS